MTEDKVVAVAFLSQRDLNVLGTGFRRLFAIDEPDAFADLLAQLDTISAVSPQSGNNTSSCE